MPTIHLTTFIAAPAERVFDLSRSIDLHQQSMKKFGEEAVSGIRSGLIEKDEIVTWKARHLGKKRLLKVKITAMEKYASFTDEQLEGSFKQMKHEHYFKPCDNGTIMIDLFTYEPPYGLAGRVFGAIYLTQYLRKLLETRNLVIREYAESDKWRGLLKRNVMVM
jgi:ligand-binding SRPBCC domain-containing protein